MFIINLTYTVALEKVDTYLEEHIVYLKEQYAKENFIMSGRKNPRTGGIILSNLKDREKLLNILEEDPFKKNNLAEYEIIEFEPSMTSKELDFLKQ